MVDNGPNWEYFCFPEEESPEGRKFTIGDHKIYQMKNHDGEWVNVEELPESFIPKEDNHNLKLEWSHCLLPGKIDPLFIRSTFKNIVLYKVLQDDEWKVV